MIFQIRNDRFPNKNRFLLSFQKQFSFTSWSGILHQYFLILYSLPSFLSFFCFGFRLDVGGEHCARHRVEVNHLQVDSCWHSPVSFSSSTSDEARRLWQRKRHRFHSGGWCRQSMRLPEQSDQQNAWVQLFCKLNPRVAQSPLPKN